MSIFFWRLQCFLLFCFVSAAQMVRPSFFLHVHFSIGTSRAIVPFFALCLFRTFEIRGGTKYGFCLVCGTCYFFFSSGRAQLWPIFFRTPILKKKSLMVRPWCAQNVILFPPIIMVSLLITRFLLPALRCTLFASHSLLLSARCSMIGYCFS